MNKKREFFGFMFNYLITKLIIYFVNHYLGWINLDLVKLI